MKYYMVNETDASGAGRTNFTYYKLSDSSTLEDAKEIYTDENLWVKYQECSRMKAFEIDESTYNAGLAFNRYNEVCNESYNREWKEGTKQYHNGYLAEHYNFFATRKWAEMFANPNKIVRIGYPKLHNVYKMDENRNLHFVYHYCNDIDFRDDTRGREVISWYKK
ncbi:hypothetical protein [Salmonella enterica]|uniref:hypothetical protein n=1 Tax=Salmonella enterica TaxID=28901 RepID=UPI003A800B01